MTELNPNHLTIRFPPQPGTPWKRADLSHFDRSLVTDDKLCSIISTLAPQLHDDCSELRRDFPFTLNSLFDLNYVDYDKIIMVRNQILYKFVFRIYRYYTKWIPA